MEYITHVETNKRTLFWTFIRYIRYAMSFLCLNMQKKTGKQQKKYTVAVCAIFKNESVFLKEWLEYHLLIGVEHFYLYNNMPISVWQMEDYANYPYNIPEKYAGLLPSFSV